MLISFSRMAFAIPVVTSGVMIPEYANAQTLADKPSTTIPDTSPAADQTDGIGDIIVTATRREERLQNVPVSVSAVSGDKLAQSGITDTRQLTQVMPNLNFSRASTTFQPVIRGVGTRNANAGDEPNVSVYIDGIYQPVPAALGFDLLNVERVEVLRGPQGTLFGRNSTGGLINIITPDPSHDLSAKVQVKYGSYEERSVSAYLTGGIAPALSADLAFQIYRDNGYIKDLAHGGYVGRRKATTIRSKWLFEPNDTFRLILSGSYSDVQDSSSANGQPLNLNTVARAAAPVPAIIPTEPWQSALDVVLLPTARISSGDAQMRIRLPGFDIATTTSGQWAKSFSPTDNDQTTKPVSGSLVSIDNEYYSNEIRLLSTTSGPFSWIAGNYLFAGDSRADPFSSKTNGVVTSTFYTKQHVFSWAFFAEGTMKFTDKFEAVAGVRYTGEERNYTARSTTAIVVPEQRANFDKLTYRFSLQYKFTPQTNIYATYGRGFKSGVFNGFATTIPAAAPTKPEVLDSIEVGLKSDPLSWLRVNVSGFHYNYNDIQQSARGPNTTLVLLFNAARARINGGELELTARAGKSLNMRAYATYLDAKYTSFPTAQVFEPTGLGGNVSVTPYDASGKQMIRAPKYTIGASFDYAHETKVGTFGVTANVYHSAKYYWDFENRLAQPAYTQVNGEVSFTLPGDKWKLAVWGKNLANEVVYSNILSAAQGDIVGFERPRTYGLSLTVKF